jgi:hypothetical protein
MTNVSGRLPDGTGLSPSGSSPQAVSPVPASIPSAAELLSVIGDLSQALCIMLACERCWGSGTIMRAGVGDECPRCLGRKSHQPGALRHAENASRRCEELSSRMVA